MYNLYHNISSSSLTAHLAALGCPAGNEVQLAARAAGVCGELAMERPAAKWGADGFRVRLLPVCAATLDVPQCGQLPVLGCRR